MIGHLQIEVNHILDHQVRQGLKVIQLQVEVQVHILDHQVRLGLLIAREDHLLVLHLEVQVLLLVVENSCYLENV